MRAFVRRLRVGGLGAAQRAAGAVRDAEATRQLPARERDEGRLRRAEGRRARLHGDGAGEHAEDHRRARPVELARAGPRQHFRQHLRDGAGRRHRAHRACQDERRGDAGLVGAGVDLHRTQHRAVPHHRRVGVDEAGDDGVLFHEIFAEHDLRHRHRVGGALRLRDRAHERLVGVLDVRIDHVQVTLVHRQVHRLAHRAARMVDRGRHVGELHEVAEILDGRVAAAVIEIAHEGRAIDRREHRVVAADGDVALRVARILHIFARRRFLDDGTRQPAWEADAGALHVGARLAPQLDRFRLVAELDAHFLQDGVGIVLDDLQPLLAQHLVDRDLAGDERILHQLRLVAEVSPGLGAARAASAADATLLSAGFCDSHEIASRNRRSHLPCRESGERREWRHFVTRAGFPLADQRQAIPFSRPLCRCKIGARETGKTPRSTGSIPFLSHGILVMSQTGGKCGAAPPYFLPAIPLWGRRQWQSFRRRRRSSSSGWAVSWAHRSPIT